MEKSIKKMGTNVNKGILDILRDKGIDPFSLNKELNKESVKKMSFKEKIKHINKQKYLQNQLLNSWELIN